MLKILPLRPDGSEEKYWVIDEDRIRYLIKFQKKDWTNVYSEHIASKFINLILGYGSSHITKLIKTKLPTGEKERLAVLCKDFTNEYGTLKTFKENTDSTDTNRLNHGYYFDETLYVLSKTHKIDFKEIEKSFWDMYVCDLILGNPDRHWGNWGICKKNGKRSIAPIFDNGAGLLPRAKFAETNVGTDIDSDTRSWWERRMYEFPNSKIMFRKSERKRSSYYEVWNSDTIPEYIKDYFIHKYKSGTVKRIIDIELFNNEPYIDEKMRIFISKFILLRYKCLIMNENFDIVYEEVDRYLQKVYKKNTHDWFLR